MNKRALLFVVGITAAVACVVAGTVIAGQYGGSAPADPGTMGRAIEAAPMIRVAEIEAVNGKPPRGVFVQLTDNGYVCVWDAPSATARERQGGCNRADDPLGGNAFSASVAYDGGPSIETVRDARLTGLASKVTASLEILMGDGTRRSIELRPAKVGADDYLAFGYRFKRADLNNGVGPVAIVGYDASGAEIGRQTTGIG